MNNYKWTPCKWSIEGANDRFNEVFIERIANLKGQDWFAIRKTGSVMNKYGEWEYEPMPSSRDDEFFVNCRFLTFDEACSCYQWYNPIA